jgi:hypothetical protein
MLAQPQQGATLSGANDRSAMTTLGDAVGGPACPLFETFLRLRGYRVV